MEYVITSWAPVILILALLLALWFLRRIAPPSSRGQVDAGSISVQWLQQHRATSREQSR